MPLVGFLFDTTLAAASLVFSGVAERFPNIRWALVPPRRHDSVSGRAARSRLPRVQGLPREHRRPPSTYLKEFYYDTVNFDQGALKLAIEFAGADHILAGSDYPHQIGSIPLDARGDRQAAGHRRGARGHPLAQRGAAAGARGGATGRELVAPVPETTKSTKRQSRVPTKFTKKTTPNPERAEDADPLGCVARRAGRSRSAGFAGRPSRSAGSRCLLRARVLRGQRAVTSATASVQADRGRRP